MFFFKILLDTNQICLIKWIDIAFVITIIIAIIIFDWVNQIFLKRLPFLLDNLWCDLGKSVWNWTCDIFSFLCDWSTHLEGTFCWKPHLNRSSYEQFQGSQTIKTRQIHNTLAVSHNQCLRLPTDSAISQHMCMFHHQDGMSGHSYCWQKGHHQVLQQIIKGFLLSFTKHFTGHLMKHWSMLPCFEACCVV